MYNNKIPEGRGDFDKIHKATIILILTDGNNMLWLKFH